eukprot:CAMPEP_0197039254 /NCGR_PEP_ID=MMETSP1384-20130603/16076_1 /TAXON_ID=29189 /ORGANISM="Ammonia sp." /LENGTH=110 /DNA_ID=CAMNT_0042469821 /DNA_START=162 /DNA_END=490 /DNA_ORIENTATION=+
MSNFELFTVRSSNFNGSVNGVNVTVGSGDGNVLDVVLFGINKQGEKDVGFNGDNVECLQQENGNLGGDEVTVTIVNSTGGGVNITMKFRHNKDDNENEGVVCVWKDEESG